MSHRREFFRRLSAAGAALWSGAPAKAGTRTPPRAEFVTPDLPKLAHRMVGGVKEFHLTAEVVTSKLTEERPITAWGYNGSIPGPTLEANEGDRVRVIFENRLPEMTALHWHGLEAPMEMDGSVGLGQDPVPPGGKYVYEFTLRQHGTLFYHSHFPMQEMMGQIGFFIVHPAQAYEPHVDRDFGLVIQEFALMPNNPVPNTLAMEFNWLAFNGKSGPDCTPMLVKQGERVRIRLVNLGMDHHPIHLHGTQFAVTSTEGGRLPQALWYPQNTVLVGVAQVRVVEFEAKYTGDWMLHCHLPHHMMNQMISMVGPVSHAHASGDVPHSAMFPQNNPDKKAIPGYPQDMWMPMDRSVRPKPENAGLRKGWTAAMMGMMTLVRVLPPAEYDRIQALAARPVAANREEAGHVA